MTLFASLVVAALVLSSGATTARTAARVIQIGQPFQLRAGETGQLAAPPLRVGFANISSDSRCPKRERCLSAGNVSVKIWIEKGGEAPEFHDLQLWPERDSVTVASALELQLTEVLPYPASGRVVQKADFLVTLTLRPASAEADR